MKFVLTGDSDCPIARIALGYGESVRTESGSMVYSRNVEISGGLNTKKKGLGGVFSAIGRSITSGESMFITTATGTGDNGEIAVAPPIPGKIMELKIDGAHQYRLNTGAFLACDESVDYTMVNQGITKALFGNTGGLFVMEMNGTGSVLVSAFGDILALTVTPDAPLTVDNEHVVAWDAELDYHIEVASGMFGFTTGEGLVNSFTGSGHVYIQTRNLANLAQAMHPYLPTASN
ncbi:TIGR00266 family protein [Collinsella tanakaei]|uniref:TIGR00266 family protein n=1 Tax=Collinsella tanakaei TaxID=626935 RepID=UPI0025A3E133|nr:TIGR00266 family protein [Collinsella tanakaei]MDM8246708.1 TIGR00266 family protein [Collinsella tanakaei]